MKRFPLAAALISLLALLFTASVWAGLPDDAEQRAHRYMSQTPPDWARARAAFEEAAEAGSPRAMAYLGWMFEEGQGVPVDIDQAVHWYEAAARAGSLEYAVKLGWMYMGGTGLAADRERAEYWFAQGITRDFQPARLALASVLIADAQGGKAPERIVEARELLETVLDSGEITAAYFLARLYIEGIGGHPTDPYKALHYTQMGAEANHPRMQAWLARMYLDGDGVPVDELEAGKWALLSAAGGDPLGRQLNASLDQFMSEQDKQQVVARAMEWMRANRGPNGE